MDRSAQGEGRPVISSLAVNFADLQPMIEALMGLFVSALTHDVMTVADC
jgi:hypothetical protein